MLVVTPPRCIGCRTCELACAFAHGTAGQLGCARVRVYPTGPEQHVPILCLQCSEAACVRVCPTGALVRNEETGAVELNAARCVRCRLCVVACPFGNLQVEPQPGGGVIKCDLCGGDPACAKFCPTQALQMLPAEGAGVVESKQPKDAAAAGG